MSEHQAEIEIEAPVERVWALLRNEVQLGVDYGRASVIAEERLRRLTVDVRIGWGYATAYTYELRRFGEFTMLHMTLRPHGLRWTISNAALFGRAMSSLAATADAGLANLKAAAESDATVDI